MITEQLTHLHKARVLVVGDIMLDHYWSGVTERVSPEAPVPVVRVEDEEYRAGGAANVAVNITALGATAILLGHVGQDQRADILHDLITAQGVDYRPLAHTHFATISKLRVLSQDQQLIRLDFEESPSEKALAHKLERFEKLVGSADVVILSDYGKGALGQVAHMIEQARAQNKMILVDPKGEDYEKYRGATVLTPNRSELRQVVGQWASEEDLTKRAQDLRKSLNLQALLLTRSEEGMSLYTEAGMSHVKAQAREVFDVSGAGDTVIATLAVALAAGWPLERAMALANRAGGIVVGKLGTATVTSEELQ